MQFLRLPEVLKRTGLSRSEIYRRIDAGTFPAPHKYPGTMKSFWLSTEIDDWQRSILG